MSVFEKRSIFPVSRESLWAYHANQGALERLVPPWQPVRLIENEGPLRDGKRVVLAMKVGPFWKRWTAEHFDVVEGEHFRDRQLAGPFAAWTHSHLMSASASESSELVDHVEYRVPLGAIGRLAGGGYVSREIERMFSFRHVRTLDDVRRHSAFADRRRLRVAVSGSSGAIAKNLMPFLGTGGHEVSRLVRGRATAGDQIAWEPNTGDVDQQKFAACDALVHLAGQSIAVRWTKRQREEIRKSRVDATRRLCETLAKMERGPSVLVCASAVGFYGDRGEEEVYEQSPRGEGFAAEVCEAWEKATGPARDAGIRVVNLRIGVVISSNSGAIAKLLLPTKFGVAGRVGSGGQWVSWIAMDDVVGTIHHALMNDKVDGAVNAVTGSVRQREFIATFGRVLHRPTAVPMPAAMVRLLFGQMGQELLLASAKVEPARLRETGFEAVLPTLEGALRFELDA